jgi:acyl CoA:acetate/3-ketoacid CoA transferase
MSKNNKMVTGKTGILMKIGIDTLLDYMEKHPDWIPERRVDPRIEEIAGEEYFHYHDLTFTEPVIFGFRDAMPPIGWCKDCDAFRNCK